MLSYDAFIQQTTHFQPRLILKIGDVDVTDRLVEDHKPITDALLDTPTLNVYTTSRATFCLDNSDNAFNTKNSSNFFTSLSPARAANGWQTPAEISVVFEGDPNAPTTPKIFFVGYVEQVTELPGPRWVSVLLLDKSGLLQHSVVEDFGESVDVRVGRANPVGSDLTEQERLLLGISTDSVYQDVHIPSSLRLSVLSKLYDQETALARFNVRVANYSAANPVFNLPESSAPISRGSASVVFNGVELTVLPVLPKSGRVLTAHHVAVNEETAQVHFGAEPEGGKYAQFNVSFKTAYRYRTPEFLIFELLEASGVYSDLTTDEKKFARSLINSPILEYALPRFSSHGRPQTLTTSPVVRWIRSDATTFYMGGSRTILRYRRNDEAEGILDEWDIFSLCPDTDAAILQFEKVGNDFYVLTVNTWEGRQAKLWKVTGGTSWSEISGANATATHFYDYNTQRDLAADNRKSFIVHSGYLYYVFHSGSNYGVRRVNLSNNSVSTVFTRARVTQHLWNYVAYGVDFTIVGSNVYVFLCDRRDRRVSDSYFYVYRMGLDGSGQTTVFSQTIVRTEDAFPVMVSDIVTRGSNFYFVLTYSRNLNRVGYSELSQLATSGGTRYVLKTYENSLYGARSLVVHREGSEDNIYFVEGMYLSSIKSAFPTSEDTGHLGRIDIHGMIVDLGPVWQSFRDPRGTGAGVYTAFCSNLHRHSEDGTFHLISGYGLFSLPSDDTQQSQNNLLTAASDNWVWLQYGTKLASKIPIFPTNDRTVWSLLEELASVVDFEVGFTSGQDEIETFKQNPVYSGYSLEPKGYLFFRSRTAVTRSLTIDESDLVGVSSTLDTTLVFDYVSMQYGSGIWIEKDGVRALPPILNTFLTENDGAWAEIICLAILERQKRPRLKTRIPMKFSPQLALGQRLRVTNEYHSLNETPYRVTEVQHNLNTYQTELEMREDLEYVSFFLPAVEDLSYTVGTVVSGTLPEATGGEGNKTYSLVNAPSWFTFNASTRQYSGTAALANVELEYKVTDSSDPAESRTRKFRLVVTAARTISDSDSDSDSDPAVGVQHVWSGVAIVSSGTQSQAVAIDNVNNRGHVFNYPNVDSGIAPIDLGAGDWVDAAGVGLDYYFLDNAANVLRAYRASSDLSSVSRRSAGDIQLSAGDWIAVAFDSTHGYVLERELGASNRTVNFEIHAFNRTTKAADTSKDFKLDLIGEFVSMAILNGVLHVLVGNAGITIPYNVNTRSRLDSGVNQFIQGVTDWVGLDTSDVTGRLGLYALRANGSRILAYTPGRERENDFYGIL